jgi:hypothetical protein
MVFDMAGTHTGKLFSCKVGIENNREETSIDRGWEGGKEGGMERDGEGERG